MYAYIHRSLEPRHVYVAYGGCTAASNRMLIRYAPWPVFINIDDSSLVPYNATYQE